jgi:ubiquinone biosynthesis protein COQ9
MAKRSKPADPRAALFKAAFGMAERDGWRGMRIANVAKRAGLSVADAYRIAADRPGLLDAYFDEIDARVAEELSDEPAQDGVPWREVAFDGLMLRFDAMLKNRDALRVIYFDDRRDPVALARNARRTRRALQRILETAGFTDDGLGLRLGAIALVPLYAQVFGVWLNDESDQARTMAALDKALARLERWSARLSRRGSPLAREVERLEASDERPRDVPPTNGSTH